ncbi:hypothetical protein RB195_003619 [Necator americanus]|uniref:Uncharacterized protein n=1 Tax=Necator americanus TaxID=51031 RepID=A0ABR1DQQ8_NECAM
MLLNIVWNVAVSYNLRIKIYLPFYVDFPPEKNLTTDGEVTIDILVREPTNSIVLNQNGLAIISDRCELHSVGGSLFLILINQFSEETMPFKLKKKTFAMSRILYINV